jgi:hypothetical protein
MLISTNWFSWKTTRVPEPPKGWKQWRRTLKPTPTFYENRPTLVNFTKGEYRVYAGDLRAHAAHDKLGWKQVPCNVEADVPQKVMERRAILDNTHREGWDSDALANWDFEIEELEEMGVPDWVFGNTEDYSDKNKEVDVDGLESLMTISLKYEADEYWKIKEQLSKIAATPEQAVWKLLGNE